MDAIERGYRRLLDLAQILERRKERCVDHSLREIHERVEQKCAVLDLIISEIRKPPFRVENVVEGPHLNIDKIITLLEDTTSRPASVSGRLFPSINVIR